MKGLSLKQKMYLQMISICLLLSSITGLIIYKNNQTSKLFINISHNNLPKIDKLGSLLASFRDIRIQVRSIGLSGNTSSDLVRYEKETIRAITEFSENKVLFSKLPMNNEEKILWAKVETSWDDFHEFGKGLLVLLNKGDADSLAKLNDLVRNVCQGKADVFVKNLQELITYQKENSDQQVSLAVKNESTTNIIALSSMVAGLILSLVIGGLFARRVSRNLEKNISVLKEGSKEIEIYSNQISNVSTSLSEASVQQASSLQQTVSSIDEISAMISRNADNAQSSAQTAEISLDAVRKGKEKVRDMVDSINVISSSNEEIVEQMRQTTQEISDIVAVIQNIATKTQVINDIVFQTKLLSFNASVEAARAGENGKGFAVVAEEVGNLASMSGQAAGEISSLLKSSTDRVETVVSKTQSMMAKVIQESKSKVDAGIMTASDCSKALDEIYASVVKMADMVKEISVASSEQSVGVREVNRAMIEFDKVSQANTSIARDTSDTAEVLRDQAERLNLLVASLTEMVEGSHVEANLLKFPERKDDKKLEVSGI